MSVKISVVSTLYKSSQHIGEFCLRSAESASKICGDDYEIILVNDGSPDDSLEIAIDLGKEDSHIKVVNLSRNFGHYKAMMTGLSYASGDRVFLIDSDLEEDPEYLNLFDEKMKLESCDVVFGVQSERRGSFLNRLSGKIFYLLFNFLTGLGMPQNLLAARLMSRAYVEALLLHKEREIFIAGLWHITGFNQIPCAVKKHNTSETTYTFKKKISLLVDSVTSFSHSPLVAIFYTGFFIFSISFVCMGYILFMRLIYGQSPGGWASLILSIWLLGGLIIFFMGIIGIYMSKIFSEVKQRPYTIIKSTHGFDQKKKEL